VLLRLSKEGKRARFLYLVGIKLSTIIINRDSQIIPLPKLIFVVIALSPSQKKVVRFFEINFYKYNKTPQALLTYNTHIV
jgi:hypothetical protein